ncbi:MAG: acetyltransferase [Cytophagales bacterium]|nr:acetyltransferase [Cytophagales bacterium]
MERPVIIFGASDLAKDALEIFQRNNIVVYGFLADDTALHGTEIDDVPVMGRTEDAGYLKLIGRKCEAFVAVENIDERQGLVKLLHKQRKITPINAIHPSANIAASASIGYGNLFNTGVSLAPGAKIGSHCIIHTHALVEHDAEVDDFVQIGAGSIINGNVKIEKNTFIGAGVTIVAGIKIEVGARIGAGAVVLADVKKGEAVLGNPAKPVKL